VHSEKQDLCITGYTVRDIRFPTSGQRHGSDAMNPDPDYSAAYIVLWTDRPGMEGHGLTFTVGRGTEICCLALHAIAHHVVGRNLDSITSDFGGFVRSVTRDTQVRWLGPEKGVVHMAAGALINAVWDLYARAENKPVWKLLSDMSPEQIVSCIDFSYIQDVLKPSDALSLLDSQAESKAERVDALLRDGYPAYTTSAGWLGYNDDQIRTRCRAAIAEGWRHIKMKVGADLGEDVRRAAIIREEVGYDVALMMDANQNWGVDEAIENMRELARFRPLWIEEPTSPDDILGHAEIARKIAPIKVATGEHCQNRVVFKQLMQANAVDVCQIDSCRVAGVNENLAIMLMARKFDIPVCPHAGGVGLCEYVQHLAMFDYVAISGTMENRLIEYVDHLHEHFVDPVVVRRARYIAPRRPGFSIEMRAESLAQHDFDAGPLWKHSRARHGTSGGEADRFA